MSFIPRIPWGKIFILCSVGYHPAFGRRPVVPPHRLRGNLLVTLRWFLFIFTSDPAEIMGNWPWFWPSSKRLWVRITVSTGDWFLYLNMGLPLCKERNGKFHHATDNMVQLNLRDKYCIRKYKAINELFKVWFFLAMSCSTGGYNELLINMCTKNWSYRS